MKKIHLPLVSCSMLASAWQAEYRTSTKSDNNGFIGMVGFV